MTLVHGENVRAYVTLRDASNHPGSQELIRFARERVGYKAPEEIVVLGGRAAHFYWEAGPDGFKADGGVEPNAVSHWWAPLAHSLRRAVPVDAPRSAPVHLSRTSHRAEVRAIASVHEPRSSRVSASATRESPGAAIGGPALAMDGIVTVEVRSRRAGRRA